MPCVPDSISQARSFVQTVTIEPGINEAVPVMMHEHKSAVTCEIPSWTSRAVKYHHERLKFFEIPLSRGFRHWLPFGMRLGDKS